MHFAVQPTSPGVQALMHFTVSDWEVWEGDSLVVEVTVWRVAGVVMLVAVVWAVATASRPERRRVVKRILDSWVIRLKVVVGQSK
jgi:hypothetical protein